MRKQLPLLLLVTTALLGSVGATQVIAEDPATSVSQQKSDMSKATDTPEPRQRELAEDNSVSITRRPVPSSVSATPPASDQAIRQRLLRSLQQTGWYRELGVQVDEGIVTLSGSTTLADHKTWASDLAYRTEGVLAVVNRMEVTSLLSFSDSWAVIASSLRALWRGTLNHLPLLVVGAIVLLLTWGVAAAARTVVERATRSSRLRTSLRDLFKQLATITAWVLGILIACVIVFPGMTPAKLLTVFGLGSVAIGFAFKDIFENFFAGVLILWKFPFDKQDFVECGEIEGQVEDITIRNTLIRTVDGQLQVVPNAMLFTNPVSVWTNWRSRRVTIICGVAYGEDVDASREVILRAVKQCESVRPEKPVEIFAQEFGSSSINFEVTWWTGNTPLDRRRSRDEVVAAVKSALDQAGIEIPFPYRTLTFKEPLALRRSAEN